MFVILLICRLLIHSKQSTIEQTGIVLIVTLINSVDLLAVCHELQYHDVILERFWMYIGLVLVTIGLFRLAFIDTDGLLSIQNRQSTDSCRQGIDHFSHRNLCPLLRVSSSSNE
jgi:hypothetical protein